MFAKASYLFTALALYFFVSITSVSAEVIRFFDVEVDVAPDGTFMVVETIAYDFEENSRHGIFRFINTDHPQPASKWYFDRYLEVEVLEVTKSGEKVPFTVDHSRSKTEIKIGDENKIVTGLQIYEISYVVSGGLFYENELTEFYWNVVGNEWEVEIEVARIYVTAPENLFGSSAACYVGIEGEATSCSTEIIQGGMLAGAHKLTPGEGMTAAFALQAGTVEKMIFERWSFLWLIIISGLVFFVGLIIAGYYVRTKHKIDVPFLVQYEPYKNMRPMYAGTLIDGELHPRDITAGIIYLAEQGFLKIKKIEKKIVFFDASDYEVSLLKSGEEAPGKFLHHVLALLFGDNLAQGQTVALSDIKRNLPKKQLNEAIIGKLRRELKEDLKNEGYIENSFGENWSWWSLLPLETILFVVGAILSSNFGYGAVLIYAAVLLMVAVAMKFVWTRSTHKGYEAQNHLKGFKHFLSMTDKERFSFHNSPAKSPEVFLEYLPYAIAFGVEKEWAKAFAGITIPNPSWYDGAPAGAFYAAGFTNDMRGFSNSLSATSSSVASSGGGSVGGGAGGGGGRSW